ncbi:hypothetical protein J5N97_026461 [Dioscorea zingiberensis]|uniref:Transcription factor CBF/NF-Y/archaeal histone domain-containing protein n=1 Tax=Dioscorea zingiberensis TaxID=325984 RepID=A0A9D5C3A6_9LILI|nr:hypothetical protein J5N97_026461 [Dioscorea zingiberensis]
MLSSQESDGDIPANPNGPLELSPTLTDMISINNNISMSGLQWAVIVRESEANDRCQREQRKTITAEDIIWAMSKLGFNDYVEPLSVYLQRYREVEGDHRGAICGELLPLKRSQSDISATAGVYGVLRPYPVAPPPLPHGYNGFGGGYYVGVYGDGSGASSPQGAPMGVYDAYSPYN